jgi:peptidoglycan/LPS O-acetylase OafA/YrhL
VPSLDVLRGLMALSVAVYHMSVWTPVFKAGEPVSNAVAVLGVYSVQGFFIISGFCFFHLYGARDLFGRELLAFHVKRFFRIAPLYYLALGLNFALHQHFGPMFTWPRFLGNLTLTFGLSHPNYAMVLGGWSIGLEYVFYLAFPLLLLLSREAFLRYAVTLSFLVAAYPYTFGKVAAAPASDTFHTYVQIPNHAFLFMLGAVLVHLRSLTRRRLPAWTLLFVSCAALWALCHQDSVYDHVDIMVGMARVRYVLGCFLIVLAFAFTELKDGLWLGLPALLGKLSYSVYLLHPFAWLIARVLAPSASPAQAVALGLLLTLLLAALVYYAIEEPLLGLGQRLARRIGGRHSKLRVLDGAGESQTQTT